MINGKKKNIDIWWFACQAIDEAMAQLMIDILFDLPNWKMGP